MVKPGGTGRPRLAISARLAPLPPSRSRKPALPSALPSPKVNTHWPGSTPDGFAAGLAGIFFSALRAAGAALRTGADGFDFAAIFLDFATALAMAYRQSERGMEVARLTPFWRVPRKPRNRLSGAIGAAISARRVRSGRRRSNRSRRSG